MRSARSAERVKKSEKTVFAYTVITRDNWSWSLKMIDRILEGLAWVFLLSISYPIGYAIGSLILLILYPPPLPMIPIILR